MTEEQQARYARHLVLKDIGEAGQDKFLNSSVLIIGTGEMCIRDRWCDRG